MLRVDAKGLIDCYHDGCNWQGVEFRQYDLRQAATRDFYTRRVIGDLISSPSLDVRAGSRFPHLSRAALVLPFPCSCPLPQGTFIDVIDWWTDSCGSWGWCV